MLLCHCVVQCLQPSAMDSGNTCTTIYRCMFMSAETLVLCQLEYFVIHIVREVADVRCSVYVFPCTLDGRQVGKSCIFPLMRANQLKRATVQGALACLAPSRIGSCLYSHTHSHAYTHTQRTRLRLLNQ